MTGFKGKRILVTGACGSVGDHLIRKLLTDSSYQPAEVIGLDNHESNLFFMDQAYLEDARAHFYVADVRNFETLNLRLEGIDIVFHCAGAKHVIMAERSPNEAVCTNVDGVQNVIAAAHRNAVERVIFTSTDKAVNPTNVMGTTKLLGERLMTVANSNKWEAKPVFASTRFGNVLGSNGSVVTVFHNQIAKGGPITLTHPEMTRFVMGIEDAARLVLDSAELAEGGEVFITKMVTIRIRDLATAMIRMLAPRYGYRTDDIEVRIIGTKPGEKRYEELMSTEEMDRSTELENYFSVLPAFRGMYRGIDYAYDGQARSEVKHPYISSEESPASVEQIMDLLEVNDLLSRPDEDMAARYWPGDKEEAV